LETTHYSKVVVLSPEDNRRLLNLCGRCDEHIRLIEKRLEVIIKQRGYTFSVSGNPEAVEKAITTLNDLYHEAQKSSHLASHEVHLYLQAAQKASLNSENLRMDIRLKRETITARGDNQVRYIKNILNHDINFAVGPRGQVKRILPLPVRLMR